VTSKFRCAALTLFFSQRPPATARHKSAFPTKDLPPSFPLNWRSFTSWTGDHYVFKAPSIQPPPSALPSLSWSPFRTVMKRGSELLPLGTPFPPFPSVHLHPPPCAACWFKVYRISRVPPPLKIFLFKNPWYPPFPPFILIFTVRAL